MYKDKLVFRLKQIFSPTQKVLSSKEGINGLFRVSLIRNAIHLLSNYWLLSGTGFVFWIVAARLYDKSDLGVASAAISATALLALLSTLGMDFAIIHFLPNSGKKAGVIINSCFLISLMIALIMAIISLIGIDVWSPRLSSIEDNPFFIVIFISLTVATVLMTLLRQTFIAQRKSQFTLVHGLGFGLMRFVPLIILAFYSSELGIFTSWGLAMVIAVFFGIFLLLPISNKEYRAFPAVSRRIMKKMFHFASTNYIANVFWMIPGFFLPIMVLNRLGDEVNATFYIVWNIANILFLVPMAASFSLFAEGSYNSEKLGAQVKSSLKLVFFILVPIILILLLAGNYVLLIFGSTYSEDGTSLLRILAVSAVPVSINYIYCSIKRIQVKMKKVVTITTFTGAGTVILSYILIDSLDIIGVGLAWLCVHTFAALIVMKGVVDLLKYKSA